MTVLITGVAGFIGSTLAERLLGEGHTVVGIDNFSDYYDRDIKERNLSCSMDFTTFTLIDDDLNSAALDPILADIEFVYHQAGQPGVRKSWGAEFERYVHDNISATQRLLEAVRHRAPHLQRFVFASSSSVYGDAERYPTTESDRPQPRSPYGVTKLAAENLVSLYAANFEIPAVSLRYFTVYGPRQRPDMAFHRFITSALAARPVQVFGDGNQIREFTYIDDIVDANIRAGVAPPKCGEVINLSGGSSVSVNEAVSLLETIHGGSLQVDRGDSALGDVRRTGGSTERARSVLGWEPQVRIEDGLAREYQWLSTAVKGADCA